MHLINVSTMELEEFLDDRDRAGKYVTLSHRWKDDEVLFKDMQKGTARNRAGYAKMKSFCSAVQTAGYAYAWCDTCCIDKSSSSELSESINSMFRWYQNAAVTYVYLSDVETTHIGGRDSEFGKSEWWSRGWCLQELLAPPEVKFFNCYWKLLGTKEGLRNHLAEITGIPRDALHSRDFQHYSISQRMSWASKRKVTRVEDTAYCLLGLFQVNMPLLYGEGDRAFTRLQEEIMKQSSDHSLFVHTPTNPNGEFIRLLAQSPSDFLFSADIVGSDTGRRKPFRLTNMGLSIKLLLYPWSLDTYLAVLDCHRASSPDDNLVICLSLPSVQPSETLLAPVESAYRTTIKGTTVTNEPWTAMSKLPTLPTLPKIWKKLYLQLQLPQLSKTLRMPSRRYGFWIREFSCGNDWKVNDRLWAVSWNEWDPKIRRLELSPENWGTVGIVVWENDPKGPRAHETALRLGFTLNFEPVIQFNGSMNVWRGRCGNYSPISLEDPGSFSGGNEYFKKQSAQTQAKMALSVTRWMEEPDNYDTGRFLFKARDRHSPIQEKRSWGHEVGERETARRGIMKISCKKEEIEGVEIWVLDLNWTQGKWDKPKDSIEMPYRLCEGCHTYTLENYFECTTCAEWFLCVDCGDLAKVLHDPDHRFRKITGGI